MSEDSREVQEEQIKARFDKLKRSRKVYTTTISILTALGWPILVVINYDKVWPYASVLAVLAAVVFCVWRYSVLTHAIQIAFAAFSANQSQQPLPKKSPRKGFRK